MRSKDVVLTTTLVAAAAIASGCSRPDEKRCVDINGMVVRDEECQRENDQSFGTAGPAPRYRWYYGGVGAMGAAVSGGSYAPSPGRSYVPSSRVSRGGFGSSGFRLSPGA